MELEKKIESKVKKTLKKTGLGKNKKILVALSGGKDSTLTAHLLKKFGFNIEGFHIDLKIGKYSNDCLKAVKELCKQLDIKLHIYDIKKEMGAGMCYLRSSVQSMQKRKNSIKNCAVCGVIKKWIMNREARKLKADFIATGHNMDDEAQTFLMNILKGSPNLSANIGEVTKNFSDEKFIPRIKPLFYVSENDIREFAKQKKLPVVYEKCPCSIDSYRVSVREFLDDFSEENKKNILKNFKRVQNKIKKIKVLELKYCKICKEPSRKNICKKCELLKIK